GGGEGVVGGRKEGVTDERLESGVYLLADPSFAPVAGNLKAWPTTLKESKGWYDVNAREWKPDAAERSVLRATFDTLPDGYHLLVGRDADDLDAFTSKIKVALLLGVSLIFVLAGVASVSVTRRTVGRIEAINATSRYILQRGIGKRIPLRGRRVE